MNREKRNEAVYVYRPLLFFFSLSLSPFLRLLAVGHRRTKGEKKNRRKKQQEAIRADGQGDSFEQKIEFTITMS